jgi:hypothetical protein
MWLAADFDLMRVENDDGIDLLQRPELPFSKRVRHRVCNAADPFGRNLQAADIRGVRAGIANS